MTKKETKALLKALPGNTLTELHRLYGVNPENDHLMDSLEKWLIEQKRIAKAADRANDNDQNSHTRAD